MMIDRSVLETKEEEKKKKGKHGQQLRTKNINLIALIILLLNKCTVTLSIRLN